jgi:hypothetical protein
MSAGRLWERSALELELEEDGEVGELALGIVRQMRRRARKENIAEGSGLNEGERRKRRPR